MSRFEKLIKRLEQSDRSISFNEIKKVLESLGYVGSFPAKGSSHCTFRKKGRNPITISKHAPIGIVYIKMVRDIVREEINNDEKY